MSDDILSVIPTDPRWQPEPAQAKRARSVVEGLLQMEDRDEIEIEVTWHDHVAVVPCGENLERITCPHCAGYRRD